jgi:hypothetical protein
MTKRWAFRLLISSPLLLATPGMTAVSCTTHEGDIINQYSLGGAPPAPPDEGEEE